MAWKRIIIALFLIASVVEADEVKLTKIVSLNQPWGSSFINDEEIILTEKEGKIKIVNINTKDILDIEHNLNFLVYGQGGLLDILYKDQDLWISYSEDRGDWKTSTSIGKAKLNKKKLSFSNIFQANPPIDLSLIHI